MNRMDLDIFNQPVPSAKRPMNKQFEIQTHFSNDSTAEMAKSPQCTSIIIVGHIPILSVANRHLVTSSTIINESSSLATRSDTFYRTGLHVFAVVSVNSNVALHFLLQF